MKTDTYLPGRLDTQSAPWSAVLALLAIGLTSGFSAQAAPPVAPGTLTQISLPVRLSDLDLSTTQGVHAAYERIRAAAKHACTFTTHMGDYVVGSREVYSRCFRDTMANTIKQLDRTQLAALHQEMSRVAGY